MIFQSIGKFIKKNASGLLTLTGIFGFGVSCYATAKAYQECKERIKAKKEELQVEKLPVKEVVKVCWKPCVRPLLAFSTSTICILGARNILLKEKAAYAALYKATETALAEFKAETKKEVGAETFKKIEQQAVTNQAKKSQAPIDSGEIFLDRPLFYDTFQDKYFRSTDRAIQDTFHDFHNRMTDRDSFEDFIPYSDLYYELYGSTACKLDYANMGYYSEEYSHRNPFRVSFGDYYITAPNGERAIPITYDYPKEYVKDSERI